MVPAPAADSIADQTTRSTGPGTAIVMTLPIQSGPSPGLAAAGLTLEAERSAKAVSLGIQAGFAKGCAFVHWSPVALCLRPKSR